MDLDLLTFEAAPRFLVLAAHSLLESPMGVWRPAPPGSSGIKHALRAAKLGRPLQRWFDLTGHSQSRSWKSSLFLRTAVSQGRLRGGVIPLPEPTPPDDPSNVARWLEECVRAGRPAVLSCPASAAVRVCRFARDQGADIAGTVFWVGGEPVTLAKSEILHSAGARSVNGWSLSETGPVAIGCARRDQIDETHLLHSKVAVIPGPASDGDEGHGSHLLLTTILPLAPKLRSTSTDRGILVGATAAVPSAKPDTLSIYTTFGATRS